MAKLDAYNAPSEMHAAAKPSAQNHKVRTVYINLFSSSVYQKFLFIEPWLRRSLPFIISIFLVVLAVIRFTSIYDWRHTIDKSTRSTITLLASHVSNIIDRDLLAATQQKKASVFSHQHLQNILANFRNKGLINTNTVIAIVDQKGNVLASSSSEIILGKPLQDFTPESIALQSLGQHAGTMQITIGRDEPALASFHQTENGQYGVFISEKIQHTYMGWRKFFLLNMVLFIGTSSVVLTLLYAYYNQIVRARNTDLISEKIQNRIDMAMMRGRCGLWDWNMASGRVYWSRAMYEMLGYVPQDALLSISQITAIINPNDANFFDLAQELMSGKKKHIDINVPMRHADGHHVWMRIRAEITDEEEPHLVGIAFDISEQRQLAEETAQADLRIRDAIENISESFVLWDSEGRLVMSNSKFCEYAAIPKQVLQSGIQRATVEAISRPAISEYPLKDDGSGNLTSIRQTADGCWLKINERRTQDGGLVCIGTDISELKQQQEKFEDSERRLFSFIQELKRARGNAQQRATEVEKLNKSLKAEKERAESANKAKSEFLANMSHELRTPLNAILGFSDIMLQSTFGPLGSQRYKEYMHDIYNSGTHLLTLINDILDMSKIEAGKFTLDCKNTDLEPIISEAARTLTPQAHEKNISVTTNIAPELHAEVDIRAMKQIFLNLISNAVKFTPSGGSINVCAFKKKNNLVCKIKDTGVGIPQSAIKKLGQPFEQVENQLTKTHAGSGLGLAISRSLLELHKGKLEIISKEMKGTTVTITMPIKQS
ncbi:PAS domain-containing protein [Bartonella taylorii]|uniref:histidine kinase n=2 Tax=Bartonella taylorii TaxID=33046 RepID=A0A9Q8YYH1_BARTA|nr:ATP-binding protein [Bartonella taylorii]EJF92866.1 PAS domain S-box protein [Bartonella taylorii 8TBB]OPB34850.1 two-component system, cell cycle sensor histidine kinase PleC [Bartonella taylorii]USP00698.1 PAS domain-containing protein [Bartonella taylorii]USP02886.1 PAS domain-containing protein [Bartonella taylorii]